MYIEMTVCLDMLDETSMKLIQQHLGDVRAKIDNHKKRLKRDKYFILLAGIFMKQLRGLCTGSENKLSCTSLNMKRLFLGSICVRLVLHEQ